MRKTAMFFVLAVLVAKSAEGQELNPNGQISGAGQSTSLDASTSMSQPAELFEGSRWFARFGAAGVIYHTGVSLRNNGAVIPGATIDVSHDQTLTLAIGYDITKNIFISLMGGIPRSRP